MLNRMKQKIKNHVKNYNYIKTRIIARKPYKKTNTKKNSQLKYHWCRRHILQQFNN